MASPAPARPPSSKTVQAVIVIVLFAGIAAAALTGAFVMWQTGRGDTTPSTPAAPTAGAAADRPPGSPPASVEPPRPAPRAAEPPRTTAPPPARPRDRDAGAPDEGTVRRRLADSLNPPPLAPPPARALRVGGRIPPPAKRRNVQAVYPADAQAARIQGIVIIEATIGRTGKIEQTRVLRSVPMLDDAALRAVRQWEYEPTLVDGTPVPIVMTVTVNFTLQPRR